MEKQKSQNLEILNQDKLMTRQEVADFLKVSLVTLYNLRKSRVLTPSHKVGRKPLYLLSQVLEQTRIITNTNLKNIA